SEKSEKIRWMTWWHAAAYRKKMRCAGWHPIFPDPSHIEPVLAGAGSTHALAPSHTSTAQIAAPLWPEASQAIGAPSTKTFSSPSRKGIQTSLVVSGSVTITATLSLGVVTWEKSTLM